MKKKILIGLGVLAFAATIFAAVNSGFPFASQQWPGYGPKRNIVQFVITAASNGASSDLLPGVTGTNSLGTSVLRFLNIFTTNINVSGTSTLTGTVTAGRVNFGVQLSTAPRTSSTLVFNSTGTIAFDTTDGYLCVSTGSAQSSFVQVSTSPLAGGYAACGH